MFFNFWSKSQPTNILFLSVFIQNGKICVFQDSRLVLGVAFKKTFSYAGFEMQQKSYKNPKIALLNIELELKAERDNAEIRIDNVNVRSKNVTVSIRIWKLFDLISEIFRFGRLKRLFFL